MAPPPPRPPSRSSWALEWAGTCGIGAYAALQYLRPYTAEVQARDVHVRVRVRSSAQREKMRTEI